MVDLRLALMCGTNIPIPECQLIIRQPKIKEIALIGEREFFSGIQTLCIDKNMVTQDEQILKETSNFEIFMAIMKDEQGLEKKQIIQQIFPLFFPSYKVNFMPRGLAFVQDSNVITIDESNFGVLQEIVGKICCLKSDSSQKVAFNPANDAAKKIAEKLMRGRQKVAEQKGEADSSIFTQYLSILTIGLNSMSIEDLMNLTIFQMYDLIERYSLYIDWDLDVRSRLAGAKPDGKPENWMKNLH